VHSVKMATNLTPLIILAISAQKKYGDAAYANQNQNVRPVSLIDM